jgi:hypothetical protein
MKPTPTTTDMPRVIEIGLINSELKTLIDEDDFELVSKHRWYLSKKGYAYTAPSVRIHRLIMRPASHLQIDHINHNKLDNRKSNLRICTGEENARNCPISIRNTSGFKGVSSSLQNRYRIWRARIFFNKKEINIGSYKTKEEAAEAYNKMALKHYGEFAVLNLLPPPTQPV